MSNILAEITDELISLIKTNYPRFKDKDRIQLAQEIEFENLGYEDCIMLDPQPTNTTAILTAGAIMNYTINLVYLKKLYNEKISGWSDFAESLDSYLLGHTHHSIYWILMERSINYDVSEYLPEDYEGDFGGFVMTITFTKYKAE